MPCLLIWIFPIKGFDRAIDALEVIKEIFSIAALIASFKKRKQSRNSKDEVHYEEGNQKVPGEDL